MPEEEEKPRVVKHNTVTSDNDDDNDTDTVDGLRLAGEVDSSKTEELGTKTFKEKAFEQPTLYSFIYAPQDVERTIKRSRFLECKRDVLILLSKGPMRLRDLEHELFDYGDVRFDVIAKLKRDKIIKIGWSEFLGDMAVRLIKKHMHTCT